MSEPKDVQPIPTGIAEAMIAEKFWAVRGKAIQAYANIEQALCRLFIHLSGMRPDLAGIIFFKIVNVGTLYGILEKLIRKKYGVAHSLFWNSFLKILRSDVSEVRNQIVHWNAAFLAHDNTGSELVLMTPNFYDLGPNSPSPIRTSNMVDFMAKCMFFTRLCDKFLTIQVPEVAAQMNAVELQTWRDIFLQPVVYPPPQGHPLGPSAPVPGTPPPPSPP